ncbi:required for excision 1-B domain-containing protein isoform X2 [Ovis aries]|uniref:Required for excision 1-B domain containing n=1 Tax=Ovis aries TaxID=9940 RepID=A0AC11B0A9_SHEEP|nr:required for excision 1-B domain-containing protein isoform X2 [Ovis aries]
MITAEAASESAVLAVPGDTAAPGVSEREELVWPWKDAPIRALVQRIHQLQAERAQAFRRLEEGHRQYLSSGPLYDFPRYRSTVHEVTQVFAAASREVLALEAELAGPRAQPLLASHVRSLQQLEETRLTTDTPAPSQTPPLQRSCPLWLVPVPQICYSTLGLGAMKLQVALLQLMGTPELTGQEDSLQMHQLKMNSHPLL